MPPSLKPDHDSTDPLIANGPALLYVSTQDHNATQSVQRIDLSAPENARERAISRALLHHALALIDDAEDPAGLLQLARSVNTPGES